MLTVTMKATDPWLLTIEQAREAAGLAVDDASQDAVLDILRATASAQIFDALNIAVGAGGEPTIRRETLTETLRLSSAYPIVLKRRHNVVVTSVTGWPGIGSAADYVVDAEAGIIRPAEIGCNSATRSSPVVVVYQAGFETVPPVLVAAASDMIRLRRSAAERDPLVKKEVVDVDGVDRVETEFWVTAAGASAQTQPVPPSILATLKRFRNSVVC